MECAAGEFRHGNVIPTFLATPARHRLVWAKIAICLALGLLTGLVAAAVQVAIVLPWAAATGHGLGPWSPHVLDPSSATSSGARRTPPLASASASSCATSSSPSAFGWFTVAEFALAILLPDVSRFLPGAAFSGTDTAGLVCCRCAAVPLVAAWVVAISTLALRTTLRRDIA